MHNRGILGVLHRVSRGPGPRLRAKRRERLVRVLSDEAYGQGPRARAARHSRSWSGIEPLGVLGALRRVDHAGTAVTIIHRDEATLSGRFVQEARQGANECVTRVMNARASANAAV